MTTSTPPVADRESTSAGQVAVISASVRADRMSPSIADWVVDALKQNPVGAVDLIDLAEITLPDDRLLNPGGGPKSEVAERIDAAEAFVFVTPEYNHSYPASLKRMIDWHYSEWALKPATIVGYGVHGGYSAIEHLRAVLAELNVVPTRRAVGLSRPWESLDNSGCFVPDAGGGRGLAGALAELAWWSGVLIEARRNRPFPG